MEKEKVLEIESQEVFDKVAVRIKHQNFGVLKRGEFEDREIKVKSSWAPQYVIYDDELYIQGKDESEDSRIFLVDKEDLKKVLEKVNKINEKYGIPKRWRAEYKDKYFAVLNSGKISEIVDYEDVDDNIRYNLGNYFKTLEEAEKVKVELDKFWERVRAGEIGGEE